MLIYTSTYYTPPHSHCTHPHTPTAHTPTLPLHTPRSQAKAAIAYRYDDGSDSDDSQAKRDEQLLASYLGEDVEKEKAFSSESEYGGCGWGWECGWEWE